MRGSGWGNTGVVGFVLLAQVCVENAAWSLLSGIFYWWNGLRVDVADLVLTPWRSALSGVARQLLTFFASPKNVSKERRPQEPLHTKVCHPSPASVSRGRKQTRYAQTSLRP